MYAKIAIKNIKKSFKDYSIYFITLTLAVCIFYNFNSLNSQTVMKDMNKIDLIVKLISYISVFISVIFGGLVIYANNGLIKKRKKEFGIYAVLGMSKSKVSKILIVETLIAGLISLILGMIVGIILSQGISVIIGKLFAFPMDEFRFVISTQAITKTLLYFTLMFLMVMIFNTMVVSKQKLIHLLQASRVNEEIKMRNPIISVIIFLAAIAVLSMSYYLAWKYASTPKNVNFPLSILWGGAGTLLFFFGLAGVILTLLKKCPRLYYNKLNIFIIKQFYNKINTNFISMSMICLMLFVTIVISASSISIKTKLEDNLKNITPFDGTIELNIANDRQKIKDINKALTTVGFQLNKTDEYTVLDAYDSNIKLSDLFAPYANQGLKAELKNNVGDVKVISITQYNQLRKLSGESPLDIDANEALLLGRNYDEKQAISNLIENKGKFSIKNIDYTLKKDKQNLRTDTRLAVFKYYLVAVLPDSDVIGLNKFYEVMFINSTDVTSKENLEQQITKLNQKFSDTDYNYTKLMNQYGFILRSETKTQVYNQTKSNIGTILYIGFYLGFVFLIASAAVLAIQQLTEASDSINRYKTLKKIGVSDQMIHKSIFIQILIQFLAPLSLALIHAAAGLVILDKLTKVAGLTAIFKVGPTLLFTGIIVIIIYGSYLYAAYTGYKNIVINS